MKCDELKYEKLGDMMPFYPRSTLVIRKQFVDEAIDELKARIHELESMPHTDNSAVIERLSNENERLVKCCKEYDSRQRIDEQIKSNGAKQLRATKRALWLARKAHAVAMFSYWDSHYIDNPNAVYRNRTVDWLRNRWLLILDAIIKKEKEYK